MSDVETRLLSEGFSRKATVPVGVPHHVWKAELDIEFDRSLRLAEETILRLIRAGVARVNSLAELMGIAGEPIVPRYAADLIIKGLVSRQEERLVLTTVGRRVLVTSLTREERTVTVEFRHDPYRDAFFWDMEDEVKAGDLGAAGLKPLPAPEALSAGALSGRHRDLQELVSRDDLPFKSEEQRKRDQKRRRDVLRVRPAKYYVAYRPALLEVWVREDSNEVRWRLIREGGDEELISRKLQEMEASGVQILPLEDWREPPAGENDPQVRAAVDEAEAVAPPSVLDSADHRPALRDAIQDAQRELIIISPWLRVAAVDQVLLDWFRHALDRRAELRIAIGYGIEDTAGPRRDQKSRKQRDQEEAIRRLQRLGQEYRGRLKLFEIGNTHQKIVLVDERYAIITSFNFLSFNPLPGKQNGKGLRLETGVRVIDPGAIAKLRGDLVKILHGVCQRS